MIHWLVVGLLGLPVLSASAMIFLGRRDDHIRAIGLVGAGSAALCAAILYCTQTVYTLHTPDILFRFSWLPGTGSIGLHLSSTSLMLVISTTLSLCFAIALGKTLSWHVIALSLFTLSAANVAFLSANFLGRYVALEIVGLGVALAPLFAARPKDARFVYVLLRIGDAGFLIAILLLMRETGTLNIEQALAAGTTLSSARMSWVVTGFALAVWVKAGAWPFHSWLEAGRPEDFSAGTWLYTVVMPGLGLYLLYRITPLLAAGGLLRIVVLVLGIVALLAGILKTLRSTGANGLSSVTGGVGLILAAVGAKTWVRSFAWTLPPLHLLFARLVPVPEPQSEAEDRRPFSNIAQHIHTTIEIGGLERGIAGLPRAVFRLANWLHRAIEQGGLERAIAELPRAVLRLANWFYRVIEQSSLERAIQRITHNVLAAARWLQRQHTGRLRANLTWAATVLLIVVAVLVLGV